MSGKSEVRYKWVKQYRDREEAMENARWLHLALVGNLDYEETRILLNVGEFGEVLIAEFEDSETHINVIEEDGHPVLEMFKK